MHTLTFHPIADIFPLLSETDAATLADDIRARGLREPIVLHPDGRILDGRNRYLACLAAGVEPRFETWDGVGSALAYVVSLNIHRRHLDASQLAMVAARLATMRQGERTDLASIEAMSQPAAAALLHVSRASVQRARTVLDFGTPELVQAVDRGEIAVSVAADLVKQPPESQRCAVHLAEAETQIAPDFGTFVEIGAALREIRDDKLYLGTHATFEAYCQDRGLDGLGPFAIEVAGYADPQCLSTAHLARMAAEQGEAKASPSRWAEADCYAELHRRGWTHRRIAKACGTNKATVSEFIACVRHYSVLNNRPLFRQAYMSVMEP